LPDKISVKPDTDIYQERRRGKFNNTALDGQALKKLVAAGLAWLRTNQQTVNALNVFPVPDGDTGINMVLTMQAALNEISDSPEHNFGRMVHKVAQGALMGARGNSGVILSQLWRGFARASDNIENVDAQTMALAFAGARDTAYKGVVRPVEGTILTVAKDIAAAAAEAQEQVDDPVKILECLVQAADQSVEKTPELLAELRKAGVVDAGGKGLFYILEGMLRYIDGLPLDSPLASIQPLSALTLEDTLETIEPGQDFEVVVDFRPNAPLDLPKFYRELETMGTSIQVGEGEGIYRMHIHVPTEKLYAPIEYTRSLGTVSKVSMENLIEQMAELEKKARGEKIKLAPVEPGQIAVIVVSPGLGISRVFADLRVAGIVEGGQTMNPSTQDILDTIESLPTDKVIVLPNNKNIILAAESAAALTTKKVVVVPSRTVPEGISAVLRLVPEGDFDQVVEEMRGAIEEVQTGEITTASRDAEVGDVSTKEGMFIGLLNRELVCSASTIEEACLCLLNKAQAGDYELLTLFYGADLTKQEANRIADIIRASFPGLEVELLDGGQPHYQFILSIE
jgi:DAK2 domain fusion protein YloV